MGETEITYCDRTWDLTIGCRKRSEGCANCWATRTVHRLAAKGLDGYCTHHDREPRVSQIQTTADGKDWLPTDSVNLLDWRIGDPLNWRKPQFVFVNSKSDLFDGRVSFEFIGDAFDVMHEAKQHRFMVLTKEPVRMAAFLEWYRTARDRPRRRNPVINRPQWPQTFPHVILMVSVESPDHMDRIDTLLQIPAAMRGVSIEPMLEPLAAELVPRVTGDGPRIDWVVVGCEKLMGGRAGRWAGEEIDAWWGAAAMVVKACRNAGVPVWMKQGPDLSCWKTGVRPKVMHGMANFPPSCGIQQKPAGLLL